MRCDSCGEPIADSEEMAEVTRPGISDSLTIHVECMTEEDEIA